MACAARKSSKSRITSRWIVNKHHNRRGGLRPTVTLFLFCLSFDILQDLMGGNVLSQLAFEARDVTAYPSPTTEANSSCPAWTSEFRPRTRVPNFAPPVSHRLSFPDATTLDVRLFKSAGYTTRETHHGRIEFEVQVQPNVSVRAFYEGSLSICSNIPCGHGSLCVSAAAREVYCGEWNMRGEPSADTAMMPAGFERTIAGLVHAWHAIHAVWIRLWRSECDGSNGPDDYIIEAKQAMDSFDDSWCGTAAWHTGQDTNDAAAPLVLPVAVVDLLTTQADSAHLWIGHLSLRPRSIKSLSAANAVCYNRHSGWISAEAHFRHYDTAFVRSVRAEGARVSFGWWFNPGAVFYRNPGTQQCPEFYKFKDFLQARNARAVMYSPDMHRSVPSSSSGRKGTGCSVFFQGPDGAPDTQFDRLLDGFPVAMPASWAELYFPDQWHLAQVCPNVPILTDVRTNVMPQRVTAYAQLISPELLYRISKLDAAVRFSDGGAFETSVSVMWALLDHAFGMHGARLQLGWLEFFGREESELYPDGVSHAPPDPVDNNDIILGTVAPFAKLEVALVNDRVPGFEFPPVDVPCGSRYSFVADGADNAVLAVGRPPEQTITNVAAVKCRPWSGYAPWVVRFRLRGEVEFAELAVSTTTMLQWYQTEVLVMAYSQVWSPERIAAVRQTTHGIRSGLPVYGVSVSAWPYNQFRDIGLVGNDAGASTTLGCGRNAVRMALQTLRINDRPAEAAAQQWDGWIAWSGLPALVTSLHWQTQESGTSCRNTYNLVAIGSSKLALLQTPLGREMLHGAGIRRVLLHPVAKSYGWSQHVLAVTADDSGVWTLRDPAFSLGRPEQAAVVLWGRLPNVQTLEGAYIVNVLPATKQGRTASNGMPRKISKLTPDKQRNIPEPPTANAACHHFVGTAVDCAFAKFVVLARLERKDLPGKGCVTSAELAKPGSSSQVMWEHLAYA